MALATEQKRIAIIGNMNNNGFSLMRYFRDLGADAYLLPYSTDGVGNLVHFSPSMDTWSIQRWKPFIRPLEVPNTTEAILGRLHKFRAPPSRSKILAVLEEYDLCVGSGVAPALFERLRKRLDIFFPYSVGIEFYDHIGFGGRGRSSVLRWGLYRYVRRLQERGIRHARICLNADMSRTSDSFSELGKRFERLAVPMVYNREKYVNEDLSDVVRSAIDRMSRSDFCIVCFSRLLWKRDERLSQQDWLSLTKNSDWLLYGLAEFMRTNANARPLLVMAEYGPDVAVTRKLVAQLGLESFVHWLPKRPRREIMLLHSLADISVGEFSTASGVIWGGTGWEALASGRPLLQSFNFKPGVYDMHFGHPPPPLLDVKSSADVSRHLIEMHLNPERRRSIGQASVDWFNNYNGVGLARRWLDLLRQDQSARHE